MGKVTDSPVQSTGDVETQSQRETGGFRRARGERNLKSPVAQGRCARLGRVRVSGTDELESKAQWIGRCAAQWTRPRGDDTVPRSASAQWERQSSRVARSRRKQGGTGNSVQNGLKMLLSGVVKMSNPSWCEPGRAGLVSSQPCALRARGGPLSSEALGRSRRKQARIYRCWRASRPTFSWSCTANCAMQAAGDWHSSRDVAAEEGAGRMRGAGAKEDDSSDRSEGSAGSGWACGLRQGGMRREVVRCDVHQRECYRLVN